MRLDLDALPTDPGLLHRLVRDLVDALDAEREAKAKLARQVAWLSRQHFGAKSEQVPDAQLRLWLDALDEDAGRLAKLPPREELLAELAGAMQAPLAALVFLMEGKMRELMGLLEALRAERDGA